MIDCLKKLASKIWPLRFVAIGGGVVFVIATAGIIFSSNSREEDRYLIPSVVGLLWSLSTYAFIITFQSVPDKTSKAHGFWRRLKRSIHRIWFWLLAIVCAAATVAGVFLTFRLISIWFSDYYG